METIYYPRVYSVLLLLTTAIVDFFPANTALIVPEMVPEMRADVCLSEKPKKIFLEPVKLPSTLCETLINKGLWITCNSGG